MDNSNYYKAFVAQTTEEILHAIFKKEEDILIGVSLTNGAYIEGTVLDITTDSNQNKSVCMITRGEEISFFNLYNIALVTIKQPKKMVVELSKGKISRPFSSTDKNLTVLQLKIWLRNEKHLLGEQIQNFNVDRLSLDKLNNRLNVKDFFEALVPAIDLITADALGKDAWSGVETIVLEEAETLQLQLQTGVLTISVAIHKALPANLSKILEEKLLQLL
ncbi:hypothetical protein [Nonlabens sp. Asnod2-A12]|uniref:hypothetical protein n=1 Tax=Nonlabens sp. Asnod2-A12 TaxID=3160578 RepID=UPI00386997D6